MIVMSDDPNSTLTTPLGNGLNAASADHPSFATFSAMPPAAPYDEAARLEALARYAILDTTPEKSFDRVTALAARWFRVPIAMISLVDAERQWLKSCVGPLPGEAPREVAFCAHTILSAEVLIVPDAALDPRFCANPLVTGEPFIRFYAGAPLITSDGFPLGSLCLIDTVPRTFSAGEAASLQDLAAMVVESFEARRMVKQLAAGAVEREDTKTRTRAALDAALDGIVTMDHHGHVLEFNRAAELMFGRTPEEAIGRELAGLVLPPTYRQANQAGIARLLAADEDLSLNKRLEIVVVHANGLEFPVELIVTKVPTSGHPVFTCHFRDLSTRRVVEDQLRMLESSVENANDAILVTEASPQDEPGPRILYINKGFTTMTGYSAEEVIGKTPRILQGAKTSLESKAVIRRALTSWQPVQIELLNYRKDGSEFWVELNIVPVADEKGWCTHWVSVQRDVTERKRTEDALRASETKLRQLADAMPQIVWTARPDGVVDYCNEQWYEYTGITPGTDGNAMWQNLAHPDDLPLINARWEASVTSGEPYELEYRFKRAADGVYRWFLSRARAVKDADGRIVRWYGTSTDISERKQIAEEFRRTAERLGLALDAARLGPWEWDPEKGTVLMSPEHNAMYDIPREQRHGDFAKGMLHVHPDDRERVVADLQAAIAEHRDCRTEMRSVHRDGSTHWIVASGRAVYDEAGKPLRMIGVVQDITERKAAEEAMLQSEERFRLANFYSPYPVMLHAEDGELLLVNAAWARASGQPLHELTTLEEWLRRAYPAETDRSNVRRFIATIWDQTEPVENFGRCVRHADGSERTWDFSSVNLGRLRDGRRVLLSTAIDVTERHRAGTKLLAAKIEAEAATKAAEIARSEAEKANRAKSEFLSRMSHELRTPLNAILGFGQVLALGSLAEQDAQCVSYILKGGKHLLGLIDEVLDLSRVEAGELGLKPTAVNLDKLARDCVGLVAKMALTAKVACKVKTCRACRIPIWVDEQRLRQVLLNLLANAIKYNRPGGQVSVSCEHRTSEQVRLLVTDTGPGISSEDLARLFVPFERLGQEYGEVEGTGLGLVVSKRLTEAMGGSIGADSVVDEGSTFWIELPNAKPADLQTAPTIPSLPEAVGGKQTPAATILYVEDNDSNLQVVRTVISRLRPQWLLLTAKDGISGLAQAREHLPNLILLDLQLPGLKGDAVLMELRQDLKTNHLPIWILSADATPHSRERLLALGANDYLSKPFDVQNVLAKLDSILSASLVKPRTIKSSRTKNR